MKKPKKKTKLVAAEAIARLAERGEDIARFFTNAGRMVGTSRSSRPMQKKKQIPRAKTALGMTI